MSATPHTARQVLDASSTVLPSLMRRMKSMLKTGAEMSGLYITLPSPLTLTVMRLMKTVRMIFPMTVSMVKLLKWLDTMLA
uniref:Uncharacterized protein n=1 Tax=Arundo donax TaxID=35708 RepID=A0A0A9FMN2_ARUDO